MRFEEIVFIFGRFGAVLTNCSQAPMKDPVSDDQFIALLLANQNRIFRFVLSLVPSHTDSEDLFQQTCVTLWQNRGKYDPAAGEFSSWAFAIAHNHVRNFRRKESTRNNVFVSLGDALEGVLVETREAHGSTLDEWHSALTHCIERLNPKQRSLLEECYGVKASLKEVSHGFGCTPNALYKTVQRIRGLLHDCVRKTVAEGGAV
jgi:RNA polymerase sigma-70 factor (ECF subfamily)